MDIKFDWGNVDVFSYEDEYRKNRPRFYLENPISEPVAVTREIKIPGSNNISVVKTGAYSNEDLSVVAVIKCDSPSVAHSIASTVVDDFERSSPGYNLWSDADGYYQETETYSFYAKLNRIRVKKESDVCYKVIADMTRRPEVFRPATTISLTNKSEKIVSNICGYESDFYIDATVGNQLVSVQLIDQNNKESRFSVSGLVAGEKIRFDSENLAIYYGNTRIQADWSGFDWKLKKGNSRIRIDGISSAKMTPRWWKPWFF